MEAFTCHNDLKQSFALTKCSIMPPQVCCFESGLWYGLLS